MDRKYRHAERNNTGGIAFRIFVNGSVFNREKTTYDARKI
jgi:hypothetical protein